MRVAIILAVYVALVVWLMTYVLPIAGAALFSDQHFYQVYRIMYRQVLP